MIDAERLLGSLVSNAMGGKKRKRGKKRRKGKSLLSTGAKGGLALGALGVAFGVYEHLTKQQAGAAFTGGSTGAVPPAPQGSSPGAPLPPLPTPGATPQASAPLPPIPTQAPPPAEAAEAAGQSEALLLVRAMIAAANADHEVDDDERGRILKSLEESGLGEEERQFVLDELEAPKPLGELAAGANTPELAAQVYLASVMAIDVDTRAEEKYLERLAKELGLDEARVAELEALLTNAQ